MSFSGERGGIELAAQTLCESSSSLISDMALDLKNIFENGHEMPRSCLTEPARGKCLNSTGIRTREEPTSKISRWGKT